ncbi:MAG: hypothetical protein CMQ20_09255 [Gammaproteobacteria bacterium]|jgi:uncharacterized protein YehS (DUF1456 family)|nr:hypothetical protein [Gammaproteobacteria bacterium]|tara:strand:+ start:412 stop:954 length:543 start_codon:yes stop_codon:yes gene_type:complete
MTNNDILRQLRFVFDYKDPFMVKLFSQGGLETSKEQVNCWLKKEDHAEFQELEDPALASFLNGLIVEKRGKREGPEPEIEKWLTNNIILKKLKIALDMKAEDVIKTLERVNLRIGKSELSAFFRKPKHKHYRVCKNQILRNFIHGIQMQYRPDVAGVDPGVDENAPPVSKPADEKGSVWK